ncbi:MAG: M1 family aminopeptidase [Candidatus Acidiferrales bacterium]
MTQFFGRFRPLMPTMLCAIALSVALLVPAPGRADEPYARSRNYDLQNVKTHLWFDTDQRKVRGEVTHSIEMLCDDVSQVKFDSVALKIEDVALDGKDTKFSVTDKDLIVSLAEPSKRGDHHEIFIRYEGQPKKGLYFILPDKNYPNRPKEVWTQGEAEDTRYYIPIYDYPNDRTTSEMILTVPATWITVSNGQLANVKDETDGSKTWDWKQSEPLSTYLITAVAGEFVEKTDTWRGIPLRYVVPRGNEDTIESTFTRTKEMLDLFSDKLGVKYPWAQYAQSSVNDFVEGGMENTSATTLTARGLVNPKLASEEREGSEDLDSHELAHQWFGDLVTCRDWANIWLNEGFATYFEHYWLERHYGADEAAYEFWRDQAGWFRQKRMYPVPIVTRNFTDSIEYAGNVYTKGGWVLKMLRSKLGDEDFFRGLHHYLEVNRNQNVVTADLEKALDESTHTNVDHFFHQWIWRAGAPEYEVSYSYDDSAQQIKLKVKQTQKVEGMVDLFDMPVEIEIATASGRKTYPIEVNKAEETFTLPADGAPLMVLFDKGDTVLKSVEFKKDAAALIYQLKNAETVPDRADAAVALGAMKDDPNVVAALGQAAQHDPFWGVRVESLKALGKIGGSGSEQHILTALNDEKPWVRKVAVQQLGNFTSDSSLGSRLIEIASKDKAYTVRAAALNAIGEIKDPKAYETLTAALKTDSPDDTIRNGALEGLGSLGDDRAVPALLEWSAPGKDFETRGAAIQAVAELDPKNEKITQRLISYLKEPYTDVKFPALLALGRRGDPAAIGPLEDLVKSGELNLGDAPFIQMQIEALRAKTAGSGSASGANANTSSNANTNASAVGNSNTASVNGNAAGSGSNGNQQVAAAAGIGESAKQQPASAGAGNDQEITLAALKKLQQQMAEISTRLGKIETQLSTTQK